MSAFDNATLMITGGTGSFGSTVLKHFLDSDLKEIRIFSRDEKKQDDMRHELQATLQKSEILHRPSQTISTPIKLSSTPHHTHPEERIWAGRTPRVPDAPKIKHDKMKQFYMIDMERKRW